MDLTENSLTNPRGAKAGDPMKEFEAIALMLGILDPSRKPPLPRRGPRDSPHETKVLFPWQKLSDDLLRPFFTHRTT